MARKKLTTEFNEQVKLEIGQEFAGVYKETRQVPVDGENRAIHTFIREADKKEVDMWGAGQLNQYVNKMKPGQMVYIKRVADVDSPTFKGQKMKSYEVEVEE